MYNDPFRCIFVIYLEVYLNTCHLIALLIEEEENVKVFIQQEGKKTFKNGASKLMKSVFN